MDGEISRCISEPKGLTVSVGGEGGGRGGHILSDSEQDRLWDFWGPVQNEDVGPLVNVIENFKTVTGH